MPVGVIADRSPAADADRSDHGAFARSGRRSERSRQAPIGVISDRSSAAGAGRGDRGSFARGGRWLVAVLRAGPFTVDGFPSAVAQAAGCGRISATIRLVASAGEWVAVSMTRWCRVQG